MTYEDCTYHGIWKPGEEARLLVETPEDGPTEREHHLVVLRELRHDMGFGWGYDGSGTSRAAAAILADALALGSPDECGISIESYPSDKTLELLREDFCVDLLSQFCEEWRLRRGAILRWARGWYSQREIDRMPRAVRDLPELIRM